VGFSHASHGFNNSYHNTSRDVLTPMAAGVCSTETQKTGDFGNLFTHTVTCTVLVPPGLRLFRKRRQHRNTTPSDNTLVPFLFSDTVGWNPSRSVYYRVSESLTSMLG
jgi:hypothetical protein